MNDEATQLDAPDELLDSLLARILSSDPEAAAFFPAFREWWLDQSPEDKALRAKDLA